MEKTPSRAAVQLDAWLIKNDKSQRAFSVDLGKAETYVCSLLRGAAIPSLPMAILIEKLTGVSVYGWIREL